MADISYTPSFSHVDWIDNEDVVQAGGENGFNKKFRDLEEELNKISAVVGAIKAALSNIEELADNSVTTKKIAPGAVTFDKIAFQLVKTSTREVNPSSQDSDIVQFGVETAKAKAILYLPTMTIVSTGTSVGGTSDVVAAIGYQHLQDKPNVVNVMIHFKNSGAEKASIQWAVYSITTTPVG
jgi:hypothetical protein